jgi:acyl dehydratase
VAGFSELSGDFDPLHQPDGTAEDHSPFGRPVAHGLLGLSVLAGLSTEFPRAATLAFVSISDWHFDNPIFFGETVHVVTEVVAIQPHGRRAGRITWLRKLVSDDGRTLQKGNFVTLVASESRKQATNGKTVPTSRLPR